MTFLAQMMQPSAKQIMGMFDADGDGQISEEEFIMTLKTLAKEHNYEPTDEDINQAVIEFNKADVNGSGFVEEGELL